MNFSSYMHGWQSECFGSDNSSDNRCDDLLACEIISQSFKVIEKCFKVIEKYFSFNEIQRFISLQGVLMIK